MGNKNKKKDKKNKSKPEKEDKEYDAEEREDTIHEDVSTEEQISSKRQYNENDSDDEEKPKKKKKKKAQQQSTEENKKGAKSIRQQKKEKHAKRVAEAATAAKDQHKTGSLSYLSQWKHDRLNWKFMKAKQAWLYKNKFSVHYIPDASWPILMEYFESAKGNIRNMLLDDANKIIKQMDEWTESQNKGAASKGDGGEEEEAAADSDSEIDKPDDTSYKRARDLIQCLQE